MDILVVGGHGKVGRRLLKLLARQGHHARDLIRDPAHAADLRAIGAVPVLGDIEVDDSLSAHAAGADAVHRIIGVGNWVWAHVNFLNLYTDDPADRGIAGVDIYRFDDDGIAVEHWGVLQPVPDPATAAHSHPMF